MAPSTRVLGVCGSLRARSSNRAMLEVFGRVCPPGVEFSIYGGLAKLPPFNPDHDLEVALPEVAAWRAELAKADGVVLSTPEYAHGLPGSFKNALDWLVSWPPFAGKRVAILAAERGSPWATESLREILRTMSARIVDAACVSVPLGSNAINADQILARPDLRTVFEESARRFTQEPA